MAINHTEPINIINHLKPLRRNQWCVMPSESFTSWFMHFPSDQSMDHRKLWKILKQVYKAAEEFQICRVVQDRFAEYDAVDTNLSYVDWVENVFSKTGSLTYTKDTEQVIATSLMSYYDLSGEVQESELASEEMPSLYSVLCDTRPDINPYPRLRDIHFVEEHNCIRITAQSARYTSQEDLASSNKFDGCIWIQLYSDIWFPWVYGFNEDQYERFQKDQEGHYVYADEEKSKLLFAPEWLEPTNWFDNRELAYRHTPRLNQFIQHVKAIAASCGADWKAEQSDSVLQEFPIRLWDENGIILDIG